MLVVMSAVANKDIACFGTVWHLAGGILPSNGPPILIHAPRCRNNREEEIMTKSDLLPGLPWKQRGRQRCNDTGCVMRHTELI